jgi:hypothetical protein
MGHPKSFCSLGSATRQQLLQALLAELNAPDRSYNAQSANASGLQILLASSEKHSLSRANLRLAEKAMVQCDFAAIEFVDSKTR